MKPLRGGRINFGATAVARSNTALLDELCESPYFSVRRGDLVFHGWKIRQTKLTAGDACVTLTADDLEPNVVQKGVDMRLGLDIAALTRLTASRPVWKPLRACKRRGTDNRLFLAILANQRVRTLRHQPTSRYRRIPFAASRPSNTAVTTRSDPRTMFPPAKIFGLVVWKGVS
jgi:hypothetical protein